MLYISDWKSLVLCCNRSICCIFQTESPLYYAVIDLYAVYFRLKVPCITLWQIYMLYISDWKSLVLCCDRSICCIFQTESPLYYAVTDLYAVYFRLKVPCIMLWWISMLYISDWEPPVLRCDGSAYNAPRKMEAAESQVPRETSCVGSHQEHCGHWRN